MNYTNHYKISGLFFICGLLILNLDYKNAEFSTIFGYSSFFVAGISILLGIYIKLKDYRSLINRYDESVEASSKDKRIETAIIRKLVYIHILPDVSFFLLKVRKDNGKKDNFFMVADEKNVKLLKDLKLMGKLDFFIYKDIVTGIRIIHEKGGE